MKTKTKSKNTSKTKSKNTSKTKSKKISKTKINNNKKIKIIIHASGGFGNKVFSLIYGLYLYNHYGGKDKCIIYCALGTSKHEKQDDPYTDEIFIKLFNEKITYLDYKNYTQLKNFKKLNNLNHLVNSNKINNLNKLPKYTDLHLNKYNDFGDLYNLTYEMYKTFTLLEKSLFKFDNEFIKHKIDNKIITIVNNYNKHPYAIIHVRYGDKLEITYYDKIVGYDTFIIYTPQYYIDKINMLIKEHPELTIYIISDSDIIVKEFILKAGHFDNDEYKNKIFLLEGLKWWNSYYLLYKASYIIMSVSTFCFSGSYFNDNPKLKCDLSIYHLDGKFAIPDEYATSPKWNVRINNKEDKKYILNYNPKEIYRLINYKYSNI